MTDGYDCYQNALAKRVNGILKDEFLFVLPDDLPRPACSSAKPYTATTRNAHTWP